MKLKNSTWPAILTSILAISGCAGTVRVRCDIPIPDNYRKPDYFVLDHGYFDLPDGRFAITKEDAKKRAKNWDQCEAIRESLIELIESQKTGL